MGGACLCSSPSLKQHVCVEKKRNISFQMSRMGECSHCVVESSRNERKEGWKYFGGGTKEVQSTSRVQCMQSCVCVVMGVGQCDGVD